LAQWFFEVADRHVAFDRGETGKRGKRAAQVSVEPRDDSLREIAAMGKRRCGLTEYSRSTHFSLSFHEHIVAVSRLDPILGYRKRIIQLPDMTFERVPARYVSISENQTQNIIGADTVLAGALYTVK
jgi:hypothetical protein